MLESSTGEGSLLRSPTFWLALVVVLVGLAVATSSAAEEVAVPVPLQAELIVKVAEYDRNFGVRAGERAQVLLVAKPGNADSLRVATQMEASLSRSPLLVGVPHDESVVSYPGAAELAKICRARHAVIVYFGPGFVSDIEDIRRELSNVDILSVSGVADYVEAGIVLGFDVISGRPKLLVHLTQAKKQNVAFRAEALKLMKVFE